MMSQKKFDEIYPTKLTPQQHTVLQGYLQGKSDKTIAGDLKIGDSCVRKHILDICQLFGFKNKPGERLRQRIALIPLFCTYKPDLVSPHLLEDWQSQFGIVKEIESPDSGPVRLDSTYYIEHPPMEANCYREILQPGALIRIKAPQQMGKTSLMARILHQARAAGCETMVVNCQRAGSQTLNDLDTFLRWFCEQVGRDLGKLPDLEKHWTGSVSNDKCHYYFEECLLPQIDSPLVVGLDEADAIFPYQQVASNFFGLLRSWFDLARSPGGDSQLWEKLRLVIVHSTEVYTIMDVNQSPFNVGMPVELREFTKEQVQDLAQRHGLSISDDHRAKLMAMVGGHPFLLRQAFYHMQSQNLTLEELLQTAPTNAGIFSAHLKRHLWNLQKHPELFAAFSEVVTTATAVKLATDLSFKLHRMGLVHLDGNKVTLRCDLYREYFGDILQI